MDDCDERLVDLAKQQNPGADADEIERAVTMLKSGRDFIYTPFGAGPRSCIGGLFSLLTVTTIIASLIQKFDFSPDDESLPADADIPLRYDVTMCFPNGLNMVGIDLIMYFPPRELSLSSSLYFSVLRPRQSSHSPNSHHRPLHNQTNQKVLLHVSCAREVTSSRDVFLFFFHTVNLKFHTVSLHFHSNS